MYYEENMDAEYDKLNNHLRRVVPQRYLASLLYYGKYSSMSFQLDTVIERLSQDNNIKIFTSYQNMELPTLEIGRAHV